MQTKHFLKAVLNKKIIFLVLLTLFSCHNLYSQTREERIRIKDSLKTEIKNYSWQKGDKLPPIIPALLSAYIPGTGQLLSGNYLKGLRDFGLVYGSLTLTAASAFAMYFNGSDFAILFIISSAATIYFYVKNIINAVNYAKLYNLEHRNSKLKVQILPSLEKNLFSTNSYNASFGIRISF
jgi:hypothetical protein